MLSQIFYHACVDTFSRFENNADQHLISADRFSKEKWWQKRRFSPIVFYELRNIIYLSELHKMILYLSDAYEEIKFVHVGHITKNYENNIVNLKNFITHLQERLHKCPLTIIKMAILFWHRTVNFNFMNWGGNDKSIYNFANETWMLLNNLSSQRFNFRI